MIFIYWILGFDYPTRIWNPSLHFCKVFLIITYVCWFLDSFSQNYLILEYYYFMNFYLDFNPRINFIYATYLVIEQNPIPCYWAVYRSGFLCSNFWSFFWSHTYFNFIFSYKISFLDYSNFINQKQYCPFMCDIIMRSTCRFITQIPKQYPVSSPAFLTWESFVPIQLSVMHVFPTWANPRKTGVSWPVEEWKRQCLCQSADCHFSGKFLPQILNFVLLEWKLSIFILHYCFEYFYF